MPAFRGVKHIKGRWFIVIMDLIDNTYHQLYNGVGVRWPDDAYKGKLIMTNHDLEMINFLWTD